MGIKSFGFKDQQLHKIGIGAPVPILIGVGKNAAGYLAADPHGIELLLKSSQAALDIPQALAESQLRKGHAQELVQTVEGADSMVALVAVHALAGLFERQETHDLSENHCTSVHAGAPYQRS